MASKDQGSDPKSDPQKREDTGPFPFSKVLQDELDHIATTRALRGEPETVEEKQEAEDEHYRRALRSNLSGLAFSGGGIRSATFNLGVLQALADLRLLKRFDYLSTVSGGGYIGSWLSAWIHRVASRNGQPKGSKALEEVEEKLQTDHPERIEDDAITFLRRFSNYLTPKVGFFSADTWTVGTTYLRNLLFNLLVLVSAFGLALLLPRWFGWLAQRPIEIDAWIWPVLSGLVLLVAVIEVGLHFGSFAVRDGERRRRLTQGRVQKRIVVPFLVGAVFFTCWLKQDLPADDRWSWLMWAVFGLVIYGTSWALGGLISWFAYRHSEVHELRVEWRRLILSAFLSGFLGGLGLWALEGFLADQTVWQACTWGPPLLLTLFVLVGFLQTGFAGREIHDHQREWLSRLGAWMLIYGTVWLVLFLASTAGTALYFWAGSFLSGAALTGWLGTTVAGLLAGRGTERPDVQVGKSRAFIAKAAPYVFIVGLILFLAVGLDLVLSRGDLGAQWQDLQEKAQDVRADLNSNDRQVRKAAEAEQDQVGLYAFVHAQRELLDSSDAEMLGWTTLVLFLLVVVFSWRVDINEFSMHRLYRNRLVRAYLGASVESTERSEQVQPFTGFSNDDLLMSRLAPSLEGPAYAAPLHLINTTLNLVDTTELAWQERKGASFVLSSLYSGFRTVEDNGDTADGALADKHYGYRRTRDYGNEPKKLSLGSAFTISGAAASPNMGFRTSPALAFLLTVFNVRLGWWLGNPSQPTWTRSGPRFGLLNLLAEIFGQTSDRKKYVYLSDGGHFENLGIYELVKRRCRFIVVSDAGADPKATFEDLGNAIRKCRTDLGIEIELHPSSLRPSGDTRLSQWHCAVGTIRYDRRHPGEGKGTILYLKTSVTGDESEDLHNYRRQHSEFPHQSTGDQWFDESQFESYRQLGHHVALSALEEDVRAIKISNRRMDDFSFSLEQLAHRLRQRWYPSSSKTSSFTRLTATMDAVFERARLDPNLAFLDRQFYPEWDSLMGGEPWTGQPEWLPEKEEERRSGFYFCNELIQLMENVYLDLDLAREHDHPDNRGWMNLFKHWSWSAMFKATWAIACPTYGKKFQDFCEQELGLEAYASIQATELSLGEALGDKSQLNFLEKDIVQQFQQSDSNSIDKVFVFSVEVKDLGASVASTKAAESMEFRFGFAALRQDDYIVAFRIQDHLRKMGLARKALEKLLERVPGAQCPEWQDSPEEPEDGVAKEPRGEKTEPVPSVLLPVKYRDDFSEKNRIRFEALHRSVCQERRNC